MEARTTDAPHAVPPDDGGSPSPDPGRLVRDLAQVVGEEHVYSHPHQLRTYESDALLGHAVHPACVAVPGSAEQVRDVVSVCHRLGVPWVARGAGSGLSGGALPVEDGVLIALTRLRDVVEADLENQRVVLEPGVTNVEVSNAAGAEHYFPPDPSSQAVCTVGGNVAENSGGAHCFKYGFTTTYVTGLELVLPDGGEVSLGGKRLDTPGYDLVGAFVGSEGTLGVATRVTVRVIPTPEAVRTLVAFFHSTAAAGDVVSRIVGGGIVPAAIEMMDKLSIEASEGATNVGFPTHAGAALLVELDGPEAECAAGQEEVMRLCREGDAFELRVAGDALERELIWKARKAAFAAMGRISPNYYVQDSVIPRTRLGEVLRRIEEIGAAHGLRVANVFHAGDGNLHPLVCYDASNDGEPERAERCAGEIVRACVNLGGSITGEHGVGVDKKRFMPDMFDEPDLATFQLLRCAFDPDGRANPGKVMPTPRLCGEVPGPYRQHPLEAAGLADRF